MWWETAWAAGGCRLEIEVFPVANSEVKVKEDTLFGYAGMLRRGNSASELKPTSVLPLSLCLTTEIKKGDSFEAGFRGVFIHIS